ncbi:unnamed protein product [Echinostoma caproni]|uniref:Transmembrane protein n=1 Tax=Echinostoma caproni TaxID=27848 RepID=A0A183B8Y6_9TREM|nr:unnamed protein product [Echinostoma caproni]
MSPEANLDSIASSVVGQSPLGIIPSLDRIERRHRIRAKRVNFFTKVTVIGSHGHPAPTSGPSAPVGSAGTHPAALPPHPSPSRSYGSTIPGSLPPASSSLNGDRPDQSAIPSNYASLERPAQTDALLIAALVNSAVNLLSLSLVTFMCDASDLWLARSDATERAGSLFRSSHHS